jgi:hypothetical protein
MDPHAVVSSTLEWLAATARPGARRSGRRPSGCQRRSGRRPDQADMPATSDRLSVRFDQPWLVARDPFRHARQLRTIQRAVGADGASKRDEPIAQSRVDPIGHEPFKHTADREPGHK